MTRGTCSQRSRQLQILKRAAAESLPFCPMQSGLLPLREHCAFDARWPRHRSPGTPSLKLGSVLAPPPALRCRHVFGTLSLGLVQGARRPSRFVPVGQGRNCPVAKTGKEASRKVSAKETKQFCLAPLGKGRRIGSGVVGAPTSNHYSVKA